MIVHAPGVFERCTSARARADNTHTRGTDDGASMYSAYVYARVAACVCKLHNVDVRHVLVRVCVSGCRFSEYLMCLYVT